MARYRKIDPRIWNDRKFRDLSDDGKLVFLFVLTHPHMTGLGAMRGHPSGLAPELEWKPERLQKAFKEGLAKGLIRYDSHACFIWVPNFLKYNSPESPNVVKHWVAAWDLLPECDLKDQLYNQVKAFAKGLTEGFREAFAEAFAKTSLIHEHKHEHEHEQGEEGAQAPTTSLPILPLKTGGNWQMEGKEFSDRERDC